MSFRDETKVIQIGDRKIGGGNPVLIQSMTNTKTEDIAATVAQILRLEKAGCEIIRCTVPTLEAAKALSEIKKQIHIPWWQTFILTIRWRSRPWKTGRIRSASTLGTLAAQSASRRSWTAQRSEAFPSAWA